MAIGRTVVSHEPTSNVRWKAADVGHRIEAWMGPVGVVARSLAMITLAAFAILVLLPAALAAQATMPM